MAETTDTSVFLDTNVVMGKIFGLAAPPNPVKLTAWWLCVKHSESNLLKDNLIEDNLVKDNLFFYELQMGDVTEPPCVANACQIGSEECELVFLGYIAFDIDSDSDSPSDKWKFCGRVVSLKPAIASSNVMRLFIGILSEGLTREYFTECMHRAQYNEIFQSIDTVDVSNICELDHPRKIFETRWKRASTESIGKY